MIPDVAQYEALGKELLRRCLSEEDASEIHRWLTDTLTRIGGGDNKALMTWEESFDLTLQIIEKYEILANTPEKDRKILAWPWQSWRNIIDPLEPGMLALITAPDGQGKTIYAESIAEHWARHKNRIAFVHYELNRELMMERRTARHTAITAREQKSGKLSQADKKKIEEMIEVLKTWDGYISYFHTPGWTMDQTVAELSKAHAEGNCDAVVIDYLEKVAPSRRQLQMFGTNTFQREADNVEILKTFGESLGVPVLMVAQMSKEGKGKKSEEMDRNAITGSAEKSNKANLVVLIKRDRVDEGYSNEVNILVDKNTMGAPGTFKQIMDPEHFRVGDPTPPPARR